MTVSSRPARWARVLLLAAIVPAGGCDDGGEESPTPSPISDAERRERQEQAGEALYGRYCSLCHGRDADGYAADDAPSLRTPEWLRTASDEFITAAIVDGRPGTAMSAWSRRHGGPLHEPQIEAILAYLRSFQRQPRAQVDEIEVEGDAANGRGLYVGQCARCHGLRGEGRDAVALANPAFLATASDGFIQYAILHGRTGTPMPGFADQLQPQQVNDLVAFVRSFEGGGPEQPVAPPEAPELPAIADMQLVVHPDGEAPRFELRENRFVSAEAVRDAFVAGKRMVILDARATSDWLRSRIPGAIPVPFYELDDIVEGLPRDGTPMIAYCGCPHAASGRVVDALRREGFTNTAVLDEGIHFWEEQGYPTASGSDAP